MLYVLTILSILSLTIYAGPVDTCNEQAKCIDTREELIAEGDDAGKYRMCIWFDTSKEDCDKEGTISHACDGPDEGDKIEGLEEMSEMCQIVECNDYAYFGFKDGKGCGTKSPQFPFSMSGSDPAYCIAGPKNGGGYCGGGNKKACTWKVPAPSCDIPPQLVYDTTQTPQTYDDVDTTTYDEQVTCTDLGEDMGACTDLNCCVGPNGCAEPEECDACSSVTCTDYGDESSCQEGGFRDGDECCTFNTIPGEDYGSCQQAVYLTEELKTDNNMQTVEHNANNKNNSSFNTTLLASISVPIIAILIIIAAVIVYKMKYNKNNIGKEYETKVQMEDMIPNDGNTTTSTNVTVDYD